MGGIGGVGIGSTSLPRSTTSTPFLWASQTPSASFSASTSTTDTRGTGMGREKRGGVTRQCRHCHLMYRFHYRITRNNDRVQESRHWYHHVPGKHKDSGMEFEDPRASCTSSTAQSLVSFMSLLSVMNLNTIASLRPLKLQDSTQSACHLHYLLFMQNKYHHHVQRLPISCQCPDHCLAFYVHIEPCTAFRFKIMLLYHVGNLILMMLTSRSPCEPYLLLK